MYTYIETMTTDGSKFSVGFYKSNSAPGDDWLPDITVDTRQEAAERVSYLNGGALPSSYKVFNYLVVCQDGRMPQLLGVPNTKEKQNDVYRRVIGTYNEDMPVNSKHRARVYHLQWWHGKTPVIQNFMAEDLDSEITMDLNRLPPMECKDIHHKEFEV